MNRLITLLLAAVMLTLTSCHKDEPEPKPAPMAVLVYMAADNSLGRDRMDTADINEMLTAARSGALAGRSRVLVYRAEFGDEDQSLCELTRDSLVTLKHYGRDMGAVDPDRMREVLDDFRDLAPADHYGLVLWSHASGWVNTTTRSFGQDKTRGLHMKITDLGQVLAPEEFDYIYFDCCLMMGVEVAYELRHATRYLAGSVTETPYKGMPYDKSLPYLLDGSLEALKANAQTVMDHYSGNGYGDCPVSAVVVKTAALDSLATVSAEVMSCALTPKEKDEYQQFFYERESPGIFSPMVPSDKYFDLEEYVESVCPDPELLARWRDGLRNTVIFQAHSSHVWSYTTITRHCGLSTFIPFTDADLTLDGYNELQWPQRILN